MFTNSDVNAYEMADKTLETSNHNVFHFLK